MLCFRFKILGLLLALHVTNVTLTFIGHFILYLLVYHSLTHCCLGDVPLMLNIIFDILLNIVVGISRKIALCKSLQTCTDDWVEHWLGADRHQANVWAKVWPRSMLLFDIPSYWCTDLIQNEHNAVNNKCIDICWVPTVQTVFCICTFSLFFCTPPYVLLHYNRYLGQEAQASCPLCHEFRNCIVGLE